MKLIILFLLTSFVGFTQTKTDVIVTPVTNVDVDSSSSYIYCASMEILWFELMNYLGERPKSISKNKTIDILNKSISKKYQTPIQNEFVVARSGLVKDSIIHKINSELKQKFNTTWEAPSNLSNESLISYSFLKRDVKFNRNLDDEFYNEPFDAKINVDYFGLDKADPNRKIKDIIIHDYKGKDDFVIQIKCKDSLDEIYFAKIKLESTLQETYEAVIKRINLNTDIFDGADILKIPYIKFDTTTTYTDIEGIEFSNHLVHGRSLQSTTQRVSFDLNPQGIKLESSAQIIIDFADFENPTPRLLSFDQPFLIIMKRKELENPYFLYWVSGVEFMKSYKFNCRTLKEHETVVVGKWQYTSKILWNGIEEDECSKNNFVEFLNDGTFIIDREIHESKGVWSYNPETKSIELTFLESGAKSRHVDWKLDEINSERFIIGGKTKMIYKKLLEDVKD